MPVAKLEGAPVAKPAPPPQPKVRAPGSPPPSTAPELPRELNHPPLPPEAKAAVPQDAWEQFWSDRRGAIFLSTTRNAVAGAMDAPELKANASHVNFWGPAFAAGARGLKPGEGVAGALGVFAANWAPIVLVLVLVCVFVAPVALAARRHRAAHAVEAAAEDETGVKPHLVGSGQL